MIEIIKAILYGIVEGITEWLPISSTGHLILLKAVLPLNVTEEFWNVFEVVIQLGAILAVVIIFIREIWPFGIVGNSATEKDWVFGQPRESRDKSNGKVNKSYKGNFAIRKDIFFLWLKIVVACIPGLAYGVLLDDLIEGITAPYETFIVAIMLVLVGIIFIIIENKFKGQKALIRNTKKITFASAIIIGIAQLVAAALPGTSRSGATIIAGLLLGMSRSVAAEFTFYLAIPTMFGASFLKVLKFLGAGLTFSAMELTILAISTVVSFVVSIFVIRFLMDYIRKHDFKVFGWYRIVLGILVLIFSMLR